MRLLLLDINGLLCCKLSKQDEINENLEILELSTYKVAMRPGCHEFLEFCYHNFTVGFFSSTTYPNANAILEKLLTSEQKKATVFKWFRDRTRFDPDPTTPYDTIKKLEDVFDNPSVNSDKKYHSRNTLLCDDSKVKTRFNDPINIVIFEAFKGEEDDQVLFEMMKLLPKRFEDLEKLEIAKNLEKLTLE